MLPTIMSAQTFVVNERSDNDRGQSWHHRPVTLRERIQWVLHHRDMSAREWGTKAGLSHAVVSEYLRRVKADARASIKVPQLTALAGAAGVSSQWLVSGTGEPSDTERAVPAQTSFSVEHTERYAGRAEAAAALQGLVEPEAITTVGQWDLNATQDPGALWWIERIKEADRQLKHWRKNPSAERAELEKRQADGDALEAEERAHMAASAGKPRPENDAPEKPARKSKGKP